MAGGTAHGQARPIPTRTAEGLALLICPGTGVNAGSTVLMYNLIGGGGDFDSGGKYEGVIFTGPPPLGPLPSSTSE